MRRHRFRFPTRLTAALAGLLLYGTARAVDEIAVIVAKDSPEIHIDLAFLRDIYLKRIFIDAHGQTYIPVNLSPEDPLRRAITEVIFKKSSLQIQDYWNQRYFQGITPPYVLHSQEAVLQFVAKTPGAIGYVASCRLDASVKQVLFISAPASQRNELKQLCPAGDQH